MIAKLLCLATVCVAACLLSLILTPPVRWWMCRIGVVDKPDPRRVNRVPVPRGGGLAVVAAFFGALAVGWAIWPELMGLTPFRPVLPWFVVASVVLVGTGFWDDRRGLPPVVKLLAQIVAALLMCWGGARLIPPSAWGNWCVSPWVYVPLTVIWYVGVVNAFNLIDGLDGLSSGLAIIATVGMVGVFFFVAPTMVPVASLAFIGALLGFLRYNYNPASVFLGDSGSLFVGLTLATFALITRRSDAFLVTMGLPVLCLGVPLIDTTLAVLRRTLRYALRRVEDGETASGVMTADREHVHHRFLALARGKQRLAVLWLYGLAAALVVLGFVTLGLREAKATVFLVGFFAFSTVIVRAMTDVELWDAGRLLSRPGARCGRRSLAVPLYVLADLISMAGLFVALAFLLREHLPHLSETQWAGFFLAYAVPVALALVGVRAYARIWGRSTRKDAFLILLAVAAASLLSHLVLAYLLPETAERMRTFHILWAALLPTPLLVVRLAKTAFLQWLAFSENLRLRRRSQTDRSIERLLFYGAGVNLRAYVTLFEVNVTRNRAALLGVLDDNRGLRGRVFRDLPILGPLETLEDDPDLLARLRPTRIVVTTPTIGPARLGDIRAFCKAHGIALSRFSFSEETLDV